MRDLGRKCVTGLLELSRKVRWLPRVRRRWRRDRKQTCLSRESIMARELVSRGATRSRHNHQLDSNHLSLPLLFL